MAGFIGAAPAEVDKKANAEVDGPDQVLPCDAEAAGRGPDGDGDGNIDAGAPDHVPGLLPRAHIRKQPWNVIHIRDGRSLDALENVMDPDAGELSRSAGIESRRYYAAMVFDPDSAVIGQGIFVDLFEVQDGRDCGGDGNDGEDRRRELEFEFLKHSAFACDCARKRRRRTHSQRSDRCSYGARKDTG